MFAMRSNRGGYALLVTGMCQVAVYGDPERPSCLGSRPPTSVTMAFDHGVPYQVTVAVVNYPIDAVFATFTLNNKPAASFPYLGRYAPSA